MGNSKGAYKVRRWQGFRLVPQPPARLYFLKPSAEEQLLIVSPVEEPLELLLSFALNLSGPFTVFFILNTAKSGRDRAGTYQSPRLIFRQVEEFCLKFKEFFENDSRHHLCISSAGDTCVLLLDSHNLLCCGGKTAYFIQLLQKTGFVEKKFAFSRMHLHRFGTEYDSAEREVLSYFDWKRGTSESSSNLIFKVVRETLMNGLHRAAGIFREGKKP